MGHTRRYDYIDTLKGGAIIFVVLYHSQFLSLFYVPSAVRPPLFMMISGLLFKENEPWGVFFKKCIGVLVIPYIAFNILGGIETNLLHACGINAPQCDIAKTFYATTPEQLPNTPTWFLLTLFFVMILVKCLMWMIRPLPKWLRLLLVTVVAIAGGYMAYSISSDDVHLPLFFEITFMGILFYLLGYLFARLPVIAYDKRYDRVGYALIIPLLVVYALLREYISMATCSYLLPYWQLLLMITSLFVALFYLSKLVGYVPFVTYMGRNSLIVLCTHFMLLPFFMGPLLRVFSNDVSIVITSIGLLILLRWVVVPFCKKYLPWISGDLFRKPPACHPQ